MTAMGKGTDYADQLRQAGDQLEKAAKTLQKRTGDLSDYVPGDVVREAAGYLTAAGQFLKGAAVQLDEVLSEKLDKPSQ